MNCPFLFTVIMITFNGFGRSSFCLSSKFTSFLLPTLLCYGGSRGVVEMLTDLKVCQGKKIERK